MGKFKNVEEFAAARTKFFESHPDAPVAEDIECLNLVMKREYAEQILAGTKKLEFRDYKPFYVKKLIDPEVSDYIQEHIDDDEVLTFCNDIRQVEKIHFYNYNRSWYLDVEVTFNDVFCINKTDIERLQKQYGCHDFDDDLKRMEAMKVPDDERPYLFFFVCGKVLGTDLEAKPKEEKLVEFCGGKIIKEKPIPVKESKGASNMEIIRFRVGKTSFKEFSNYAQEVFTEEISSKNLSNFFILDETGAVKEIDDIPQFRRYDAIQVTYKDDSCTRLINNADVVIKDEEDGRLIPYSELGCNLDYTSCMIAYTLGEKIEPNE